MSQTLLRLAIRPLANSMVRTKNTIFAPRNLLYTNIIISAGLSITGDAMQQCYQVRMKKERKGWDIMRTCRVGTTGLLIGPLVHFWYILLDRWLPGRTLRILVKKVLVDQLVCSPVYLALFLVTMGYMENKSASEFKDVVKEKGSVLYLAEWVIWPPAQVFNFCFLPTRYRVLYDNIVSMISDVMWSYVWYEMNEDNNTKTLSVSAEDSEDNMSDCRTMSDSQSQIESIACC